MTKYLIDQLGIAVHLPNGLIREQYWQQYVENSEYFLENKDNIKYQQLNSYILTHFVN